MDLILWKLNGGVEAETVHSAAPAVASLSFSPDGAILAVGFRDGTVELRDVAPWRKRATLRGHTQAVLALAFSADGTRLATGSVDRSIRLWDVASRQATSVRPGRCAPVCGVRFAPGG